MHRIQRILGQATPKTSPSMLWLPGLILTALIVPGRLQSAELPQNPTPSPEPIPATLGDLGELWEEVAVEPAVLMQDGRTIYAAQAKESEPARSKKQSKSKDKRGLTGRYVKDGETFYYIDGKRYDKLTPEQKERLRKEMEKFHERMREHGEHMRRAMEEMKVHLRELPDHAEMFKGLRGKHGVEGSKGRSPSDARIKGLSEVDADQIRADVDRALREAEKNGAFKVHGFDDKALREMLKHVKESNGDAMKHAREAMQEALKAMPRFKAEDAAKVKEMFKGELRSTDGKLFQFRTDPEAWEKQRQEWEKMHGEWLKEHAKALKTMEKEGVRMDPQGRTFFGEPAPVPRSFYSPQVAPRVRVDVRPAPGRTLTETVPPPMMNFQFAKPPSATLAPSPMMGAMTIPKLPDGTYVVRKGKLYRIEKGKEIPLNKLQRATPAEPKEYIAPTGGMKPMGAELAPVEVDLAETLPEGGND